MARRHYMEKKQALTAAELEAFRESLEALTLNQLEIEYKCYHNACRYDTMRLPSAKLVQEFVQVWKRLTKVKAAGAGLGY
jgi:hypothetical protein